MPLEKTPDKVGRFSRRSARRPRRRAKAGGRPA